jgi:hypothetical protein
MAMEKGGWDDGELTALLTAARANAGAEVKVPGYFAITIHKARGSVEPTDLEAARQVFGQYLCLPDTTVLDVVLAIVASSGLPGDPCWLHIVGPPSTGKTELITSVKSWPCVYSLSELTPAGLMSGRNTDDGIDHSLLPHLHGKTLAIKDFTPSLELPKDQRQKLFSRLRDAFDGYQAIHSAMVGTRSHEATFNFITGVTSAIEGLWRNSSLGERYLLFRHGAAEPQESGMKALDGANQKKRVRDDLRRAACGVLAGVNQDCVPECSEPLKHRIVRLARLLATMRTHIERDHKTKEIVNVPEPEGPSRIAQQLLKLGQGLALINRRTEITPADLTILARVALDSMPQRRRQLLVAFAMFFADRPNRWWTSPDFANHVDMGQTAIEYHTQDLCRLGVCDERYSGGHHLCKLNREFAELIGGVDLSIPQGLRSAGTSGTREPDNPDNPSSFEGTNPEPTTKSIIHPTGLLASLGPRAAEILEKHKYEPPRLL